MTSTVPPGRSRFTSIPGTSCLATISLSLRDKSHSVPNFAPFNPGKHPIKRFALKGREIAWSKYAPNATEKELGIC